MSWMAMLLRGSLGKVTKLSSCMCLGGLHDTTWSAGSKLVRFLVTARAMCMAYSARKHRVPCSQLMFPVYAGQHCGRAETCMFLATHIPMTLVFQTVVLLSPSPARPLSQLLLCARPRSDAQGPCAACSSMQHSWRPSCKRPCSGTPHLGSSHTRPAKTPGLF